jgi:hypothetical protein
MYINFEKKNTPKSHIKLIFYFNIALLSLIFIVGFIPQNLIPQGSSQPEFLNNNTNKLLNETQTGFLTYSDSHNGIKIQYPAEWLISSTNLENYDDIIAFYSPLVDPADPFTAKVVLSITPFLTNVSLQQYTNQVDLSLNKSLDTTRHSIYEYILAGFPGKKMFYDIGRDPYFLAMEAWTAIGNKVYSFKYNAEENEFNYHLPRIEYMLNSLQINNK